MITAAFERGPDRSLLLDAADDSATTLDGTLLLIDEGCDRLLALFDDVPCWLPLGSTAWQIAEPKPPPLDILVLAPDGRLVPSEAAGDFGPARFTVPVWIAGNLDKLAAAALLDRRREEVAAREAAREAERKREQRARRRRMGLAAAAAKRKNQQPDLFGIAEKELP